MKTIHLINVDYQQIIQQLNKENKITQLKMSKETEQPKEKHTNGIAGQ